MSLLTNLKISPNAEIKRDEKVESDAVAKILSLCKNFATNNQEAICSELNSIPNDANSINKFVLKSIVSMIKNNISINYAIDIINSALEKTRKPINIDIRATINDLLDALVLSIESEYGNHQQPITTSPQEQQPNPSEVNMNLGFDITRFIDKQSQPQQVQQYPNIGYIHQQQQQQQDEQRKIYVKNMINVISSHIDTSKCKINLKDVYAENLIDVTALYYIITDSEVQFQLTNRGIAPGAKFINIQSDDQSFEYKFEVGGRNVYLSTRHMVDSNNNIHFVYKID